MKKIQTNKQKIMLAALMPASAFVLAGATTGLCSCSCSSSDSETIELKYSNTGGGYYIKPENVNYEMEFVKGKQYKFSLIVNNDDAKPRGLAVAYESESKYVTLYHI